MEPTANSKNQPVQEVRELSRTAFPSYGLAESIVVSKALYDKAGGESDRDHLAAFLGYRSIDNGAFKTRVSAAKLFGLIESRGANLKVTQRAQNILMPESPEQHKAYLVEAFFAVPLFKAIYDEYKGRELPEGLGLKNALKLKFGIIPGRLDVAYRNFFDSAETAGFFETKGGSKTQLIVPLIKSTPKTPDEQSEERKENFRHGGNGGNGNGEPPSKETHKSRDSLQNEYIGTLIEILRNKSKDGEVDRDLMEKIERLLEFKMTA